MRLRRPTSRAAMWAAAALPLLAGPLATSAGAAATADGHAAARGYGALVSSGTVAPASATSSGRRQREATARSVGGAGIVAGAVTVRMGAASEGADALAEAEATAQDVILFDGRIVVSGLRLTVRAQARAGADAEAVVADRSVEGLMVDGQPVSAGAGGRIDVPGVGILVLFESVADGAGGLSANGLRLEVTDPSSGLAAGTEIVVGHVEVSAEAGDPAAASPPPASTRTATAPSAPEPPPAASTRTQPLPRATTAPSSPDPSMPAPEPQQEPPVATTRPLPSAGTTTAAAPLQARPLPSSDRTDQPSLVTPPSLGLPRRDLPSGLAAPAATTGYVFPVLGEVSFSDDYGAPRAGTGWHHGNDIFGPMGAPLVAVADGTLSKVGDNNLGGHRLWLTDGQGNSFYYAHLSAYPPGIADGVRVRAGQVIGFLGNSGQAITTPPHLHFEIHPGGGDSVDPYPYLLAWQRRAEVPMAFEAAAARPAQGTVPAAGALLVGSTPERDEAPPSDDGIADAVR